MEDILNWVLGRLSATGRIVSAIWPMLVMLAYVLGGFLIYCIRHVVKGPWRDPEIESRGETVLASMFFRQYFGWIMQPIWRFVQWTGIPANSVTTLSVLLALGAGVSVAAGRFSLGGWLFILAGCCDFIDGRIARTTNTASPVGSALDSILDRYSDSAILVGLAWYYRDSWVQFATIVALVGSLLVPYMRAKGESLGIVMKEVGMMQRVERIVYLGITVALSPIIEAILVPEDPNPPHRLAIAGIVMVALSTQLTAIQRFMYLLAELGGKPIVADRENRGKLAKNIASAAVATGIDFAIVVALVTLSGFSPWLATGLGCLVGAIVNFGMNRVWTFKTDGAMVVQAGRYAFVSLTSMLLNSGGVAVLMLLPVLDYRVDWWLVRIAVYFAWNFPLHRDYVFTVASANGKATVPA